MFFCESDVRLFLKPFVCCLYGGLYVKSVLSKPVVCLLQNSYMCTGNYK